MGDAGPPAGFTVHSSEPAPGRLVQNASSPPVGENAGRVCRQTRSTVTAAGAPVARSPVIGIVQMWLPRLTPVIATCRPSRLIDRCLAAPAPTTRSFDGRAVDSPVSGDTGIASIDSPPVAA